jgi:glucokinase
MELIRKNQYNSTILNEKDLDTRIIFKAYHEGDLLAKAVIDHAITYWGKAVANLVSIFDPEVILFGGGVFGPGVTLLGPIYNEAKRWAQPVSIQKVKLLPSKLGQDSALCGAGKMAVEMNLSS